MDNYICTVESLQCSPETIITVLIGYTSTQNGFGVKKNFFFNLLKNLHHRSKEADLEDTRRAPVLLPVIPKSNCWQNNTPYRLIPFPNCISLGNIC